MRAPKDIVWHEKTWPRQWIGMHRAHPGGIRCNSEAEAEEFMRDFCGKSGCAWTTPTTEEQT